ncbi:hypothetical protein [Shewanella fidelis]|uniref:Lipoprotein n=1 Tax=Shewanella fidelis TaxID=173509 RepID=A0AAW8NJN2_9GAMM|nr:hypothetical protein [Shewanella fidelis]MDR8522871.1 hypothetical protein [Shewanella fidelis]MDW4811803.1 hypothetical protein [Shewanella fidelis]MDW4815924.1 hypothetical protein [Shewanella fidelis]MDW4820014.1 hypothetical protein [Shewanella fidelis]MDW4824012.1 hypothetical protein [Shewanella fidelis]
MRVYIIIALLSVLLGCSDEEVKNTDWNGYAIPKEFILGDIGASSIWAEGADDADDIAIEIPIPELRHGAASYTLTKLTAVDLQQSKVVLWEEYLVANKPKLTLHETGYYSMKESQSSISWQLVDVEMVGDEVVSLVPIAQCSRLKSNPESCLFSFLHNNTFYTVSLRGGDMKQLNKVKNMLASHLDNWKSIQKH